MAQACLLALGACASPPTYAPVSYSRSIEFAGWDYKVHTNGAEATAELRVQGTLAANTAARALSILAIEAVTNCTVAESALDETGRVLLAEIDCTRQTRINI